MLVQLEASFRAPKLKHTLRAAPCGGHGAYRNSTTCSENASAPSPTPTSLMSNGCKPVSSVSMSLPTRHSPISFTWTWKKPIFVVHRWLSVQPWTRRYHAGVTILPGQPQDWAPSPPAHDALVRLKASFSTPKLMHMLRAVIASYYLMFCHAWQ